MPKNFTWTRIKGKATPPLGAFPEPYNCSFRCIRFWRPTYLMEGERKSVNNHWTSNISHQEKRPSIQIYNRKSASCNNSEYNPNRNINTNFLLVPPVLANRQLSSQSYLSVQCDLPVVFYIQEVRLTISNAKLANKSKIYNQTPPNKNWTQTFNSSMSFRLVRGRPFHCISFLSFDMISIAIRTLRASYTLLLMFFSSYCCCHFKN